MYQLRDQREAQERELDLQQQGIDLQTSAQQFEQDAFRRNQDLARDQMRQQQQQNRQSNILGLAGLGVNYGLGRAQNNAILADTGSNMAGDVAGTAVQSGVNMFGPNISRGPTGLSMGSSLGSTVSPVSQPSMMSRVGNFARNYGGALAGGVGGAMMGDSTGERILYGLGGAALGDMISGGSLLSDTLGSAVDWARTGITRFFGFGG
jgi:hypothetical protein